MKYLLLYLAAPLQSWGFDSRFDLRATFSFPTLSGVCGMLLAAAGEGGAQEELLARLAPPDADFLAVELLKPPSGREAPPPGGAPQLRDYHMVGSGYDEKDPWQALHVMRNRNNGKASAKQTYRYYLQDRKFAVAMAMADDLAERYAAALQAPVYDLYLGRKCCAPADYVFHGVVETRAEALAAVAALGEKHGLVPGRCCRSAAEGELGALPLTDVPRAFGPHKRYADRWVMVEVFPPSEAKTEG